MSKFEERGLIMSTIQEGDIFTELKYRNLHDGGETITVQWNSNVKYNFIQENGFLELYFNGEGSDVNVNISSRKISRVFEEVVVLRINYRPEISHNEILSCQSISGEYNVVHSRATKRPASRLPHMKRKSRAKAKRANDAAARAFDIMNNKIA